MRFRKKPVEVEAARWNGTVTVDVASVTRGHLVEIEHETGALLIPTLEGVMTAGLGDWIIRGVANEVYPCKDSIFIQTYEPTSEES